MAIEYALLPHLNAALNAAAAVLLLSGWILVRRRRLRAHKVCMLAALGVSLAFLTSYLVYHAHAGSRHFAGTGPVRAIYLGILLSHTLLAATVPFLAGLTAVRALRNDLARHVRIARFTLPIWLYVSMTGVVVYLMLYRLYPEGARP